MSGDTYQFAPTELDGGTQCTLAIELSDSNGSSVIQSETIDILEDNWAPAFTSQPVLTVDENAVYSYIPTVTDPDLPAQSLSIDTGGAETCGGKYWSPIVIENVNEHGLVNNSLPRSIMEEEMEEALRPAIIFVRWERICSGNICTAASVIRHNTYRQRLRGKIGIGRGYNV